MCTFSTPLSTVVLLLCVHIIHKRFLHLLYTDQHVYLYCTRSGVSIYYAQNIVCLCVCVFFKDHPGCFCIILGMLCVSVLYKEQYEYFYGVLRQSQELPIMFIWTVCRSICSAVFYGINCLQF